MKNKVLHTFVVLAYKESEFLEDCIKSVLNQKYKSEVIIATSTPNKHISELAKKYKLCIITNPNAGKGIGYDFDFAVSCVQEGLVTVAHQDDIYEYNYSFEIVKSYEKYKKSIIIFSNYYEIKNNKKIYSNRNLKIKRILLFPIKFKAFSNLKFNKRLCISLGNSICCPAVTFSKDNIRLGEIFKSNMKSNVDWLAWERLSKLKGNFIYVDKHLMGHRISEVSTTTSIINSGVRTKEDLYMLKKFWPGFIAKIINKFYKKAEKSNNIE